MLLNSLKSSRQTPLSNFFSHFIDSKEIYGAKWFKREEDEAQYSHKNFILNNSIVTSYPVVCTSMIYDVDIKMFLFLLLMVHKMALDALFQACQAQTAFQMRILTLINTETTKSGSSMMYSHKKVYFYHFALSFLFLLFFIMSSINARSLNVYRTEIN